MVNDVKSSFLLVYRLLVLSPFWGTKKEISRAVNKGALKTILEHSNLFFLHGHVAKNVYEVVEAVEVAVLAVSLHPRGTVVQDLAFRQRCSFAEVDHPHFRLLVLVMDEKERAANHLNVSEDKNGLLFRSSSRTFLHNSMDMNIRNISD